MINPITSYPNGFQIDLKFSILVFIYSTILHRLDSESIYKHNQLQNDCLMVMLRVDLSRYIHVNCKWEMNENWIYLYIWKNKAILNGR